MSKKIPWTWQLEAAARGATAQILALVVDCGCGKTLAAILIALKKMLPTIVIAPTHRLCEQWETELKDELGDEADVWVFNQNDMTREKEQYKERFEKWLTA
jgi:superfamily II DNA or RNA helicase